MTVERHFNFFEIRAYVSKYKCKNAKEALDWLAMYNSAMSEDNSNYNPIHSDHSRSGLIFALKFHTLINKLFKI